MSESKIKWQLKLLRLFCNPSYLEEIEGDLLEQFEKRSRKNQHARWLLWIDVFKLIRPKILKPFYDLHKPNSMLKHNIKISLRSFQRNKLSFLVNYIGLVAGLVTVMLIYLWVNHELSVDGFHKDSEHIYRLVSDNGGNVTLLNTNPGYAKELEASIPEIEYVVNSAWGPLMSNLIVQKEAYSTRGEFGTEQFFDLFSYPLLKGDPSTVFNEPNAVVISEQTALRLFNSIEVLGERLEWQWYSIEEPVVITGVYKNLPPNSSEQFDYVLNFKVYEKRFGERLKRGRNGRTFLKLTAGASVDLVNRKIHDHTRTKYPDYHGDPYFIIGYADYYLESEYENGKPIGGRIELIQLFIVIGVLILIIACVNFMNLSTARASLRTKEIGIRKTMGALRKSLTTQFLTESTLMCFLAGLSAIALLIPLLPLFEKLLNQQFQLSLDYKIVFGFLSIILFTGLISGSYPALYLFSCFSVWYLTGFNSCRFGHL